jgi:hypothetical protein
MYKALKNKNLHQLLTTINKAKDKKKGVPAMAPALP